MKRMHCSVNRFVIFLLLLLLVCSSALGYSFLLPVDKETASELSKSFRQKIESLKNDLEAYKRQLIRSEQELRALQARLVTLQMELEASSQDLTIALDSSESFQRSLDELQKSLRAERARGLRDKILIGAISCFSGLAIGLIIGVLL